MSESRLSKRKVPVDILFSSEKLSPPDATESSGFNDLSFVPLINIYPYLDAIESIQNGTRPSNVYHSFERSRIGTDLYVESHGEKRLRRTCSSYRRFLRPEQVVVAEIDNDRLLVQRGLLEACYAKYLGKQWITVSMPLEVAAAWDSRSTAELDKVCEKQMRTQIYTPVMHPSYRKFNYSRRGVKRLDMIRKHIGTQLHGATLLDIGCNSGFYVFHFMRQGANVVGIDMDSEHLDIARAQRSMYNLNASLLNVALQNLEITERFDIVLAMSVFWHMLGWGKLPQAISEEGLCERIELLVGKYLYWESGPDPDKEIRLVTQNTGLQHFVELGRTSATGIDDRVFGVFSRTNKIE